MIPRTDERRTVLRAWVINPVLMKNERLQDVSPALQKKQSPNMTRIPGGVPVLLHQDAAVFAVQVEKPVENRSFPQGT